MRRFVPTTEGEIVNRLAQLDWSSHPLGAMEHWPSSLHATLASCLAARSPMQIWWGPAGYVLYNDAFIPWLGSRHPRALGRRAAHVFGQSWQTLCNASYRVLACGETARVEGLALAPIFGPGDDVEGVLCTVAKVAVDDETVSRLGLEMREHLGALSSVSVRQVTRVMDDLLDIARFAHGTLELRRSHVEISAIVDHALELVGIPLREETPPITVQVARTGLPVVCDADRVARAYANVLTDVLDDIDRHGQVIVTAVRATGRIALTLTYERADEQRRASSRFALLSNDLLVLHGATLHRSQDGRHVEIVLELLADEQSSSISTSNAAAIGARRILVVEDDDACSHTLKVLLEQLGHVVALAHDGPIAVQLAVAFEPDVVLLDLGLPAVDGWEIARRVRERVGDVPMIAVTGRSAYADRERSLEAGCCEHLAKPLTAEALCTALRAALVPM